MSGGPGLWFPENHQALNPAFRIPFSDKINVVSSQQGKPCGYFEAQFFQCLEAYGARLGRKFCDLEFRDYKECRSGDKQRWRVTAIRAERIKQWIAGERDAIYENHIKMGQYKADYFSDDLMN